MEGQEMLAGEILEAIRECAREFNVGRVWLFGSTAEDPETAGDIDLAVEGLAPEQFHKFHFRLMLALPKPVDLVDLSLDPPISAIVRAKGIRIYECGR